MKYLVLSFVLLLGLNACQTTEEKEQREFVPPSKALGKEAYKKGDYFNALDYFFKALEEYRAISDQDGMANITTRIGNTYSKAGFHSMALNFYHDAFEQRKALDDIEEIAKIYYNIGRAYELNEETDKSRKFLNLADSIFDVLGNEKYTVRILNELGKTYRVDSNYVEARRYYNNALSIENDKAMTGLLFKNIGYSYHLENNQDEALAYYRKSLKIQDNLRSDVRTRLFQNLAEIHQDQDSVAWYYTQGFDKNLIWIDKLYLDAAHILEIYHKKKLNHDNVNYYDELGYQAGLRAIEQRDQLKRMYDLYQVKYAHYKEQARQQAAIIKEKEFQKLLINSVISGILLFLLSYFFYRNKKKMTKLKSLLDKAPSISY